jgi:histidyl-tRNA synthetase
MGKLIFKVMTIRGVKEYFEEDLKFFYFIEKEARNILWRLGYEEFNPPILSEASTFTQTLGQASDIVVNKEMFYIADTEEKIVLRPEFTASVAKAYVQFGFEIKKPLWKLFYVGPCFRKERPQKGRLREFYQLGIEILGDTNIMFTYELLLVMKLLFSTLGIKDYQLNINSIGCFEKCRGRYIQYLKENVLDKINEVCQLCKTRIEKNPLRILDCKNQKCQEFFTSKLKPINQFLCLDCNKDKETLFELLQQNNIPYLDSPFLVRGFDYYTGIVFEYTHKNLGAQSAFCSGGRYDNLLKNFGAKNAKGAVGCALGIERTILILKQLNLNPNIKEDYSKKVYLAFTSFQLSKKYAYLLEKLLLSNFYVFSDYSKPSLKAHLKRAESLGVDTVIIIGESEDESKLISIKDFKTGQQIQVPQEKLIEYLNTNIPK